MGRIEHAHPGKDGLVRVATVRTRNGNTKRDSTKLCQIMERNTEEYPIPNQLTSFVSTNLNPTLNLPCPQLTNKEDLANPADYNSCQLGLSEHY